MRRIGKQKILHYTGLKPYYNSSSIWAVDLILDITSDRIIFTKSKIRFYYL